MGSAVSVVIQLDPDMEYPVGQITRAGTLDSQAPFIRLPMEHFKDTGICDSDLHPFPESAYPLGQDPTFWARSTSTQSERDLEPLLQTVSAGVYWGALQADPSSENPAGHLSIFTIGTDDSSKQVSTDLDLSSQTRLAWA